MDIQNIIKPATLEEAFELTQTPNIIEKENNRFELRNVSKKPIRDLFLDDSGNIENTEIFYPSRMNEEPKPETNNKVQAFFMPNSTTIEIKTENKPSPFIMANTVEVSLHHLKQDCIIPVFSKDNERTIAHQEFIMESLNVLSKAFPYESFSSPEIRVSHQIKGRTPDAIYKQAKELLEHEKTQYYERMAFIVQIPTINSTIRGNPLNLTIGGVRAYNQENLYSKKSLEKFKFFIGFQNLVCCNMCVSTDGFLEEIKVNSLNDLKSSVFQLIKNYNAEHHLKQLENLTNYSLTEHQFAQLIGKARLYQHLPKAEKALIPEINFTEAQFNTIAKDYYEDDSFARDDKGNINLWQVYNLFTQANKSSYIDTFLDRNVNALDFTQGIQNTLISKSPYQWFLS